MKTRRPGNLNPISFLQTFVTQSIKVANQKGCSACEDHFNYIEFLGLTASSCFEAAAREELGLVGPITPDEYADVIVNIKNRIGGSFSRSSGPDRVIRVEATRCPFGDMVREAPELCRMTSSVFGGIAARNFGYAKVELKRRIAAGDDRCEVCIHTDPELAAGVRGDEYHNHGEALVSRSEHAEVSVRVASRMEGLWCPTDARAHPDGRQPRPAIVAESPEMRAALEAVEVVAPTQASVFISGETGVGKEIIARAIHALSNRSERKFVAVNCGAIPHELIESALFGHEKGAFTGACNVHQGFFERAEQGTLFLDEIDSLPLPAQAKLLRVLQESEFERVGGRQVLRADVRIIAASNRRIEKMVATNEFRSDLYYRLHVVPIHLPPLRERRDDITGLVNLILRRLAGKYRQPPKVLGEQAWGKAMQYDWPGNVRELENVLERAYLFARGSVIEDLDVAVKADGPAAGGGALRTQKRRAAREVETRLLKDALFRNGGNVSAVAREMGITPRSVHLKLKTCGIDPSQYRNRPGGVPNRQ